MGWKIDSNRQGVTHASGMVIIFEGDPESDDFSGSPGNMPKNLPAIEVARLVREGFDFYRRHSRTAQYKVERQPVTAIPREKAEVVRKGNRKPVLTLKAKK